MATQLLAVGTNAANSTDLVIAAGDTATVALKDAAGPLIAEDALVLIQIKDDAGEYFTLGELNYHTPARVIAGAGTYRFQRQTGGSCGVFSGV